MKKTALLCSLILGITTCGKTENNDSNAVSTDTGSTPDTGGGANSDTSGGSDTGPADMGSEPTDSGDTTDTGGTTDTGNNPDMGSADTPASALPGYDDHDRARTGRSAAAPSH